jgi:DNA-binding NarL/FixJ family response regulator
VRVALIDDYAIVRQGIKHQLEHEGDLVVVGEAASRETGLALVERLTPGLVVLNIRLRNKSGIDKHLSL